MSIRCALGIHRWKPVVRALQSPRRVYIQFPAAAAMVSGVRGLPMVIKYKQVGEQCSRCRKRKLA